MNIIDTTTVSVLFALVSIAILAAVVAVGIALVRVHAAGRPARVAQAPAPVCCTAASPTDLSTTNSRTRHGSGCRVGLKPAQPGFTASGENSLVHDQPGQAHDRRVLPQGAELQGHVPRRPGQRRAGRASRGCRRAAAPRPARRR